ncbi:MAG TPA: class I SAM-dependent methyltransferase [Tahibacter sp.]|nr:class I SAM-dependent methyltransferase [Tahibacter sp.]
MKQKLLDYLCCPSCRADLDLVAFLRKDVHPGLALFEGARPPAAPAPLQPGEEIWEGKLTCSGCASEFPVIGGVPRLLPGALLAASLREFHGDFIARYRDQFRDLPEAVNAERKRVETMNAFGYQWTTFLENFDDYRGLLYSFVRPYLAPEDFKGKRVLDVGCGSGRPASVVLNDGAEVIGADISQAVESAYALSAYYPNFHAVQADASALPFKPCFDFAYSVGVIQHIPRPGEVFKSVARTLSSGQRFVIWVYGKREWWYKPIDGLRLLTTRLPYPIVRVLSWLCAIASELLLLIPYRILAAIPATRRLAERMPGRIYAKLPFRENVLGWFDRLVAPVTQYFSRGDVETFYRDADFGQVDVYARPDASASWVAQGHKR